MADTKRVDSVSSDWNSQVRESSSMRQVADGLASGDLQPEFLIPGFAKFFVLRPLVMSAAQQARMRAASQAVLSAHRKVLNRILDSDMLKERHFSSFFEWTEEVLQLDRPGPIHATCLRFDGSLVDGEPVFFELNADMPQGIGLADGFARFLLEQPLSCELQEQHRTTPVLIQEAFLQAMLGEWKSAGGKGSPTIGFLTWRDDAVRLKEAELDCAYFQSRGLDALVADPRELVYGGGSLSADGKRIDLLYRIVSTGETLQRADEMKVLIEAERSGDVLMVNSFRSELIGNKAMFALLHDESCQDDFTTDERAAVEACVPWTRVVVDGRCTDSTGAPVELAEYIAGHREELVLKPTHDFGAHGVTIGDQCGDAEWERALSEALELDFIVQQRIQMGSGIYPVTDKGMPLRELYEDIDPFMLNNAYSGCITRLSEDEMTNIHLHGAMGAVVELPGE
jgi:hypothetical protein